MQNEQMQEFAQVLFCHLSLLIKKLKIWRYLGRAGSNTWRWHDGIKQFGQMLA